MSKLSKNRAIITGDALTHSEIRYRRLFESAKDGILILDAKTGKIVDVNPFLIDLLGYTKKEFIKKSIWEIGTFQDIYENKEKFQELQQQEYVRYDDLPLVTSDGHKIHVEFVSNVYLADNIKVIQCNIRDITERNNAQMELLRAKERAEESDRLKTSFLHNISHEIRTPMNAIMGFSSFLDDPELTPENSKEYVQIIIKSSDQLLAIIDDIIRIASIEAGQVKIQENEININLLCKLIKEQFSPKLREKGVTMLLRTDFSDEESIISTDSTKLTQILTNLLGNALKFTQQGYINFGYKRKGKQLEFFVEDSGKGIPQNMQKLIFNRFSQVETADSRNLGGSGLGLSISKAYAEMLGGKIWVTSQLGKGTTFYFTIQYKKKKSKKLHSNLPVKESDLNLLLSKTILAVEDEETNYLLLKKLLSESGIKLIRARNGIEAVELSKSNPYIDLVLMDIKMPEMDGYEATAKIKEIRPDLPVIAQTAYITEADRKRAIACGCSDFITKPIVKKLLISKICNQLIIRAS